MPMSVAPPFEPQRRPEPKRFETARSTLFVDRFMTRFINVGGISIITMVMGIFVFILWQILPLFRTAEVEELKAFQLVNKSYQALGLDEYSELPMLVDAEGGLTFVDVVGDRGVIAVDPAFSEAKQFTAFNYNPARQEIVYGTSDGFFCILSVGYEAGFIEGRRQMEAKPKAGPFNRIGKPGHPIRRISYGDGGDFKLAAALQEVDGKLELHAASLVQETTLFGTGEIKVDKTYDITGQIAGKPQTVLVNRQADSIVVSTAEGEVYYFFRTGDTFQLRQRFQPFSDQTARAIGSMDYLFGDVTLVLTSTAGVNRLFSLYIPPGGQERLFGQTKEFPKLEKGATFYAPSLRNKAFLIGAGRQASLRYGTTERVRWEKELPYEIALARLSGKYTRMAFVDAGQKLHFFRLSDPHPEASFRAMFGRMWYEGASAPKFEWQSTGGSDEFEPKLSLIPLIIGTLKGTVYAMLFAVPIALLAATYTSQFAHPHFRVIFKPVMEIMASLPSVVLGFLAALWLAPLLETRVPSILLMIVCIPAAAMLFGWLWSSLPIQYRAMIRPGFEFLVFAPLFVIGVYLCIELGPVLERFLFVVTDPATGARVADFRLWWPQVTGTDFQQRNSLVVGFIMGFAVIPIIFTIAEDSLSNVPATLRSGSLALGASRWQTAMRIVLPTASAGIFSALMVGLGRAVGETMIVVMATGNTPIMDFNIFSGMRTLSANIAVELPEAPHHGTLYRTLFLGAMVLFLLTFMVNSLAEILRQRLRERYKMV
jgi:phosphate transport system permease protein